MIPVIEVEANPSEHLDRLINEFFTSPVEARSTSFPINGITFNLQDWQNQATWKDLHDDSSVSSPCLDFQPLTLQSSIKSSQATTSGLLDVSTQSQLTFRVTGVEAERTEASWNNTNGHTWSRPLAEPYDIVPPTSSQSLELEMVYQEAQRSRSRVVDTETWTRRLYRRREQNRTSQRSFRARKEAKLQEALNRIAFLEEFVKHLETHNTDLEMNTFHLQQQAADMEGIGLCARPEDFVL